jgi:hypothetical protein
VLLEPAGYGTLLTLTDGPFDLRVPGVLDAYAEALGLGQDARLASRRRRLLVGPALSPVLIAGGGAGGAEPRSRGRGPGAAQPPARRIRGVDSIVIVSFDGDLKYDGDLDAHCQERHARAGVAPGEQGR